jgi:hypothetical protein
VIEPVKVRRRDDALRCDVLRVVGYRFRCDCGERSGSSATMAAAREQRREHRRAGCR